MGTIAARDCLRVLQLSEQVAAALVMACTQALELRERQTPTPATPAVRAFCAAARRITPFLDEDRPLEGELRALVAALQHRDWELYPNA